MRVDGIPYVQGRNSYFDADSTKYGVAIHNTANTAPAEGEASYATRRTDGVSAHFYCDADSVIQSLDTSARAGHAGSRQGNDNAIAVEITGTNDKTRDWWMSNVAWGPLGATLAQVCRAYGIAVRRATVAEMQANPRVRAFYSHNDMRLAWGGTDHTDPGPNFPWDKLFSAVTAALGGNPEGDEVTPEEHDMLVGLTQVVRVMESRLYALVQGDVDPKFGPIVGNPAEKIIPNQVLGKLDAAVAAIKADVADLKNRPTGTVTLTPEMKTAIVADLKEALLPEIRGIVDEELDEQSRGGADAD